MYFRRKLLCGTACLVAALQAAPSFAQPANTTQDPAKAPQTSPDVLPEGEVENVVVTAQRGPNSVPGDAVPETTLNTADIAALGASSVSEILAALGPRTGSGRGRGSGQPVILLNGRRISSFREVQGLAPEAILRVEVFPEATALQYGYSADQRVINFILKDQFRAITVEGTAGFAAEGDETSSSLEIGSLQISKKGRLSINVAANQRDSITEAERKVVRTTTANDGAYRTLTPETSKVEAGVTYNRNFGKSMSATFDLRADQSQSDSLLGLAVPLVSGTSPDPLRRSTTTDTKRAAITVNGTTSGWQWTGSGSFDTANTDTATRSLSLPAQTSKSESQVFEAGFNATGPTLTLPAGPARASIRLGYLDRGLDSFSQRLGVETRANLSRSETTARGTLAVPITSRRAGYGEKFGDISLNFNGSLSDVSDFGSLQGGGLGVNWSPTTQLRMSLAFDSSNTAPSIQQLGNPQLVTPASPIFDFKTGQTVLVNRISGGNPTLKAESRADKTFSANYSFKKLEGLDFQLSYAVNSSENTAASFPVLTPALEAAYPTRFVRNSSGVLTSIDQRPINYASADSRILRYGFSFSKGFGPVLGRGGGMGGPPGAAAAGRPNIAPASGATAPGNTRPPGAVQGRPDAAPSSRQGPTTGAPSGIPSGFGGFGGGRGGPPPGAMMAMFGGGPGGGGGGGGQAGRWTISAFHTIKLEDTLVLAPGLAPLDLLEGDAVDDNGGSRRHSVELAGSVSFLGIGMRGTGEWRSRSKIIGTNTLANGASNLYFDDVFTFNLRAFAGLDMIPNLTTKAPFLKRSRFILRIDNLLDSAQKVRDGNGVTPEAYQKALQAPRGRSVEFSWRKQF